MSNDAVCGVCRVCGRKLTSVRSWSCRDYSENGNDRTV